MAKRKPVKRSNGFEERRMQRRKFVSAERAKNVMAECFKMLGRERLAQDLARDALSELEKPRPNIATVRNAESLLKEVIEDRNNLIKANKKEARSRIRAGSVIGSLEEHLRAEKRMEEDHKKAIDSYNKLLEEIREKKKARGLTD